MPNIKSAIKRVEVAKIQTSRNKAAKSRIATYIKRFKKAIAENNIAVAENEFKTVSSLLDSAARENVIHKNSASRRIAHFAKMLDNAKKDHQLPELTQTHVHQVADAIQPSHPLSSPSPAFNLPRVFSNGSAPCIRWPKY